MDWINVGESISWEEWRDELTSRPKRLSHNSTETSRLERSMEPCEVLEALEAMVEEANRQADPETGREIFQVNQQIAEHIKWCRTALASGDVAEVFASVWELTNAWHDAQRFLGHGGALWRGQRVLAAASDGGALKASEETDRLADRDKWIVQTCLQFCEDNLSTRPTSKVLKNHLDRENNTRSPDERFDIPGARQLRNILRKDESWKSARHSSGDS